MRKLNESQPDDQTGEDFFPKIEPGEYDAICYKVETGKSFGGEKKIFFRFRIYGSKYDDVELFMTCKYYSAPIPRNSKYYDQWSLANGQPPRRGERLARKTFPNKLYRVMVRDTRRKFPNGKLKPQQFQYSVIDTIIEPLTGINKE